MAEILLSGSHSLGKLTIVDDEDYDKCMAFGKWRLQSLGYAICFKTIEGKRKGILLHRFVLGLPPAGKEIDHISRNKLDNRKVNLRFCTHLENMQNRNPFSRKVPLKHGYRGIEECESKGCLTPRYRARFIIKGKRIRGKGYRTPYEAALDYNRMIVQYRGENASVNIL